MNGGAPHFAGLWIALSGLIGFIIWVVRLRARRPFGAKRWAVAATMLVGLLLVAVLGNGPWTESMIVRLAPVHPFGELSRRLGEDRVTTAQRAALAVAMSDRFLAHYARATGARSSLRAADLLPFFKVSTRALVYQRSVNYARHLFEPRTASSARWELASLLLERDGLCTLALTELYRSAVDDNQRGWILDAMKVPVTGSSVAERALGQWIRPELEAFAQSASAGLRAKLQSKIASITAASTSMPSSGK